MPLHDVKKRVQNRRVKNVNCVEILESFQNCALSKIFFHTFSHLQIFIQRNLPQIAILRFDGLTWTVFFKCTKAGNPKN